MKKVAKNLQETTALISEIITGLEAKLRWSEKSDKSTTIEATHLRNILHKARAKS